MLLMKQFCWGSGIMFELMIQPHLDVILCNGLKLLSYYSIRLYIINIPHHKYLMQVNFSVMLNFGINSKIMIHGTENQMGI